MDETFAIIIIIALIVGVFLYFEILKLTKKIDENSLQIDEKIIFYDIFYEEIEKILENILQNEENYALKIQKEEFHEELENIQKELDYIKVMNKNKSFENKDEDIFKLLSKIDAIVEISFAKGDEIIQNYKAHLENIYTKRGF